MTSWLWTACGSAAAGGLCIQRSRSTEASYRSRSAVKSAVVGSDFAWTVASPVSCSQRGGPGPGRVSDMARGLAPRGGAPPPDLEKYSPRTSPRAACARARRPHRPHSYLACWPLLSAQQPKVVPCGGQVHLGGSRRAEGAHCILLAASSEPAMQDCVCGLVACRVRVPVPGVRECMPMATTGRRSTQPVPQGNQTGQSPLGGGRR
jgi:hypothetical protein